jgi:hypothetical protein
MMIRVTRNEGWRENQEIYIFNFNLMLLAYCLELTSIFQNAR